MHEFSAQPRAWGMPGAQRTAASRVKWKQNTRVSHHRFAEITRHSRTRMVLTVSFVLSPVTGLVCHRHPRDVSRGLDASVGASEPHDFAVRAGAVRLTAHPRPPHPAAHVRDDRETPLWFGTGWRGYRLICVFGKSEYFFERGWTGNSAIRKFYPTGKSLEHALIHRLGRRALPMCVLLLTRDMTQRGR
jgi:hypothetical protein